MLLPRTGAGINGTYCHGKVLRSLCAMLYIYHDYGGVVGVVPSLCRKIKHHCTL